MGEPGEGLPDPQRDAEQAVAALVDHERQHLLGVAERLIGEAVDERDEARAGTVRVTAAFLIVGTGLIYVLVGLALGWL